MDGAGPSSGNQFMWVALPEGSYYVPDSYDPYDSDISHDLEDFHSGNNPEEYIIRADQESGRPPQVAEIHIPDTEEESKD